MTWQSTDDLARALGDLTDAQLARIDPDTVGREAEQMPSGLRYRCLYTQAFGFGFAMHLGARVVAGLLIRVRVDPGETDWDADPVAHPDYADVLVRASEGIRWNDGTPYTPAKRETLRKAIERERQVRALVAARKG